MWSIRALQPIFFQQSSVGSLVVEIQKSFYCTTVKNRDNILSIQKRRHVIFKWNAGAAFKALAQAGAAFQALTNKRVYFTSIKTVWCQHFHWHTTTPSFRTCTFYLEATLEVSTHLQTVNMGDMHAALVELKCRRQQGWTVPFLFDVSEDGTCR
jgi:hypothetical protein